MNKLVPTVVAATIMVVIAPSVSLANPIVLPEYLEWAEKYKREHLIKGHTELTEAQKWQMQSDMLLGFSRRQKTAVPTTGVIYQKREAEKFFLAPRNVEINPVFRRPTAQELAEFEKVPVKPRIMLHQMVTKTHEVEKKPQVTVKTPQESAKRPLEIAKKPIKG